MWDWKLSQLLYLLSQETEHALAAQIVTTGTRFERMQYDKQQRKQLGNSICNISLALQDSQRITE